MDDITLGRRDALQQVKAPNNVHPGLWLDRYLTRQTWKRAAGPAPDGYESNSAKQAKELLITRVVDRPVAMGYSEAFKRWRDGFSNDAATPPRALMAEVPSTGRVLIGSGAKGAGDFGITLHHTWGVPVLPGSSLKGIAALSADRYFADSTWRRRDDPARARDGAPNAYDALFGTVEETAAVIFHDAWLVPSGRSPLNGLHRDVLTVHHPDYYQQDGALSDSEDPIPLPFVSAIGTFLWCLNWRQSSIRCSTSTGWSRLGKPCGGAWTGMGSVRRPMRRMVGSNSPLLTSCPPCFGGRKSGRS